MGCSGWQYRDWRGPVYPPGCAQSKWLSVYASRFDTVEVNSTFYRLASRDAVARWVEMTPPGFVFAAKASRFLTHMKRLTDMAQGIERYYERIQPLVDAGKLGPVLWQLPESFARDDERLEGALRALPPGRHCFELRNPSWFCEPVYELLRSFGVALAVGDDPRRPWIDDVVLTADWTFLRFHYGRLGERGNYSDAELRTWAARIGALRRSVEVYAYFNNDWEAFAPANATRMRELLGLQPQPERC
ncbi:MAG TPA: DUF72 domain-containing protein [Solirubrobacteraceae bacterium]